MHQAATHQNATQQKTTAQAKTPPASVLKSTHCDPADMIRLSDVSLVWLVVEGLRFFISTFWQTH